MATTEPTRRGGARPVVLALILLQLVAGLPYLIRGPKLLMDDFAFSYGGRFQSLGHAAEWSDRFGRPLAFVINNFEFRVIGPHPLPLFLLQVAVEAATAAALFAVVDMFVSRPLAEAVAACWILLPNHSAVDHWAAQLNLLVGLLLLCLGIRALVKACDTGRSAIGATALLLLSCACYEATIPLAAVAFVAVPLLRTGRLRPRLSSGGIAAVALLAIWMLRHNWRFAYHLPVPKGWADLTQVPLAEFGPGLTRTVRSGDALFVVATIAIAVAVGASIHRAFARQMTPEDWMIPAGLVVIVAGMLPFVKFPIQVYGMNDRANVVASVGSALVWVGVLAQLARRHVAASVVAVLLALGVVVPSRLQRDFNYWRAGTDAEQTLQAIRALPASPGIIVVGPEAPNRGGVVGVGASWALSSAAALLTGRPAIEVSVATAGELDVAPASQRLNLHTVLHGAGAAF